MRSRLLVPGILGITFVLSAACDRQPTQPNQGAVVDPVSPAGSENLLPSTAAMGKHVIRYVTNGDFAYFSASEGTRSTYLTVSRSSDGSDGGTVLFYEVSQCSEFECQTLEAGSGPIPDGDLNVTGAGLTTLRTNTAGASFSRWAGSGGDIAIEWVSRRDYETTFTGTTDLRFNKLRYYSSGSATYRNASVSGTLIAQPIPGSDYYEAQVGSSKSKTVQIGAP